MRSSNGLLKRRPLPSAGSLGQFPRLDGTMRRSDPLPTVPPRFVAFTWRYHRCALICSQRPRRTVVGGGELIFRIPSRNVGGIGRVSQVPGPPDCPLAVLLDPGRTERARPLRHARRGPRTGQRRGLPRRSDFGARSQSLGTGCLRFAVRITPDHARLASGCLAKPGRAGLGTRRVTMKGFRVRVSSSFPELA